MDSRPWTSLICTLYTAIYPKKSISAGCGSNPVSVLTAYWVSAFQQVLVLRTAVGKGDEQSQMSSCMYSGAEEFLHFCLFASCPSFIVESGKKLFRVLPTGLGYPAAFTVVVL